MKSAKTAPPREAWDDDFCPWAEVIFFLPDSLPRGGDPMKEFDEVIKEKGLPRVGQTVRSKDYGTLWRVMEKREVWETILDDPVTKEPRMIPAIYLAYWKIQEGGPPGVGKMMGFTYTLYDNTFDLHWEIVS
jgi:hypothetical protein